MHLPFAGMPIEANLVIIVRICLWRLRLYCIVQHAVLMVRPRGWHLPENHFIVDGRPIPGSLFDFGVYFFNNAKALLAKGSGPYFYLPKMESHLEARLWNHVFVTAQHLLGVPQGSIKVGTLFIITWKPATACRHYIPGKMAMACRHKHQKIPTAAGYLRPWPFLSSTALLQTVDGRRKAHPAQSCCTAEVHMDRLVIDCWCGFNGFLLIVAASGFAIQVHGTTQP